jgi:tagaturonate reductase
VLDRFSNPHIMHSWINIAMQYSSKLSMRAIPVLLRFYGLNKDVPEYFSLGFAGYLLFMKPVKKEGDKCFGEHDGHLYLINDVQAAYYFELWQQEPVKIIVKKVLQNKSLWQADLSALIGFESSVAEKLGCLLKTGANQTLFRMLNGKFI